MNKSIDTAASYLVPRYAHLPFDCNGAAVRAQCRHLATVVTISGVVDAVNVDQVSEYSKRFILPDKPFVLDLSGVNCFAAQAVPLLYQMDDVCGAAGLEWSVVPNQAVTTALLVTHEESSFPVVGSVHEALQYFADATSARRRLLLPLLTKTA
ncbi:STAS domain-containing protein [Candidatus Mycobacterium methanotrophicum]|uniref:STAS domain-containing protein n=1 Tax=Candidatus Mycobacterium methanotrophicum TaxID=2943498 RepID=A0ABY4QH44_9MYCO|nr:STAS domain-containing protein [Candidatus Mycobacterium methanotrophicum]UQX09812.1 STAS domain-containing protein [Candidatus Mycobacterium methanotrophicum]